MRAGPFLLALLAPLVLGAGEPAPAASTADASGDFCQRLAQTIGVKVQAKGTGSTTWTVNAIPLAQRLLVGGVAATGVGVLPVEPATLEDYHRLEDMCLPEKKGAVCHLLGPVNFTFIWRGAKTHTMVHPGERARVRIISTRTTCEAGVS